MTGVGLCGLCKQANQTQRAGTLEREHEQGHASGLRHHK